MAKRIHPSDVPAVIWQSVAETYLELQRRELDIGDSLRQIYPPYLDDARDETNKFFARYFIRNLNADREPVWGWNRGVYTDLSDIYSSLISDAEEESERVLDEYLEDAIREGYDRALWLLYQYGIDVESEDNEWLNKAIIVGAAIAGVSYLDRLVKWGRTYLDKMKITLRLGMTGSKTNIEVTDSISRHFESLQTRIVGLGQNELRRSFNLGGQKALEDYPISGEVWLTREDPLVCSICRNLHLTITKKQPITDSHPSCRCHKVPIMLDATGEPVDYVAFLQSIGRR